MHRGANTPEELETLLEDAFLTRDLTAVRELYGDGAVLTTAGKLPTARGRLEIAQAALTLWDQGTIYVADPLEVIQARGTALIVSRDALSVARLRPHGGWRYAITLLRDKVQPEGSIR